MAQVSTMVPSSICRPGHTNEGISTALLAMKAPWWTTAPGTARKPAASNCGASQPSNFPGTLSHHVADLAAEGPAWPTSPGTEAERQQDGFLQPLVGDPGAVDLCGHPHLAGIEQAKDLLNGGAHAANRGWRQRIARRPAGVDLGPQVGKGDFGHGAP